MVTSIVLYIICKHAKLKPLVTSLALQQLEEVNAVTKQEYVSMIHNIKCTCKIQWYAMLGIKILGIVIFIILNARKLKLFRGHMFPNTVKILLFIWDAQYYMPIKLCITTGSMHLFKITGTLLPEHVKLKRNILWDIMEIDWKEVNVTLSGNTIILWALVIIPLRDKFKVRPIVKWEPLHFHFMLKQHMTWFPLVDNDSLETV